MNSKISSHIWPEITGCAVIAEIAQAHDGSLGTAHAYIDAAKEAGADGVKFQTHIASAESTPSEPWRVRFSYQDETRYDYWKRMEFTPGQWHGLREHAKSRGLLFISSAFSPAAVELLIKVGVDGWKLASGETNNTDLLSQMMQAPVPMLISTGMSTLQEIDHAVDEISTGDAPFVILQCTSKYPTPPEAIGLNMISELRDRYRCPVGLSDHSGTIYAGLAAAALEIDVLEVHIAFSRQSFGPDVAASVTVDEFKELVRGVRFIEAALANPVEKDAMAGDLEETRQIFQKKIVAMTDLPKGTVLTQDNIALKKSAEGLPAARLQEVVGKRLMRAVKGDEPFQESDLQ